MANTPFKSTDLPKSIKGGNPAAARSCSSPAPLMRAPWRAAMRSHDFVPAAYRIVFTQRTGGSSEWAVGNFTIGGGSQEYPLADVWRTVARTRFELAPGCALQLRVIALRSGPTERFAGGGIGWEEDASGGAVRVTADYANLAADTTSAVVQVELAPSNEDDAWEPTTAGGSWSALLFKSAQLVIPPETAGSPAQRSKWGEDTTITATFEHRGGARVISACLSEVPHVHVAEHDTTDVTIHGWPAADQGPDLRPQIETRDGTTYEDHRYGVSRSLIASERQRKRLGPILANWSAYAEALAEVTDTDTDPVVVTSKSYVGLSIGSAITTWSTDNPGYSISGHYSRPQPENSPLRARTSASIPVRARVYARFTTAGSNTGRVKFQTSTRSWLIVTISQSTTWAWYTITGWLECTLAPDDPWPVLCDFAKVTGATMEVRGWSLTYGHQPVVA